MDKNEKLYADSIESLALRKAPLGKTALLLGALGNRSALEPLLLAANDSQVNSSDRLYILAAITELADGQDAFNEQVTHNIEALVASQTTYLAKKSMAKLLKKIGGIWAEQLLSQLDLSENAVSLFLEASSVGDSFELSRTLKTLANYLTGAEEGFLPKFLEWAQSANTSVRASALLCLGRVSDIEGKAMSVCLDALKDPDRFVAQAGAIAVSEGFRSEHASLMPKLLSGYERRHLPIACREALLIALSRLSLADSPQRPRLRELAEKDLFAPDPNLRKLALVVLEQLYDDNHAPSQDLIRGIFDLMKAPNQQIRLVAASFLAKHMPIGTTYFPESVKDIVMHAQPALGLLLLSAFERAHTPQALAWVVWCVAAAPESWRAAALNTKLEWDSGETDAIFDR